MQEYDGGFIELEEHDFNNIIDNRRYVCLVSANAKDMNYYNYFEDYWEYLQECNDNILEF